MNNDKKRSDRYTWLVIAASFLMVFACLGFCSSSKGLYLAAITEALGIKRSLFSINDSLRFISTAAVNLFFGRLISRFGSRKMVAAGFACLISSMLLYSCAKVIYVFYIGGILLGMGLSWTTTTMVGYIVDQWCKERKGTIMGAVMAANGLGSAVAAQIISPIIYEEGTAFGYRNAYRLTAAILAVVGVIVLAVIRDRDTAVAPAKKEAKGKSWQGIPYSEARRKKYFYAALICVFFTGMALQSVSGISSAHLKDVGFDADFIAMEVSVHAVALAACKFLSGICYDKFGLKNTILICNISAVVMTSLLAVIRPGGVGGYLAIVFGVISSMAMPLETIMLPLIVSDMFGRESYAKLLGIFVSVNTAGYAVGVPLSNLSYDLTGSYTMVLFVLSALMAVITVAFRVILNISGAERAREERV